MAAIFVGLGNGMPAWRMEIIGEHQEKSQGRSMRDRRRVKKRLSNVMVQSCHPSPGETEAEAS